MKQETRRKWKKKLILWGRLILNWRFLVCFGIAWMITNGWSYIVFGIGVWTGSEILIAIGGAYLAFLWLPISPEKVVTLAIGFFLVRRLFPKHNEELKKQIEETVDEKERSEQDPAETDTPNETASNDTDENERSE